MKRHRGIILGTAQKPVCRNWGKPLNSSGRKVFFRTEIWIHDLPNLKWELSPQDLEFQNIFMNILERQVLVRRCIVCYILWGDAC